MNEVKYLKSGYSSPRFAETRPYREMTLQEALECDGRRIEVQTYRCVVLDVKITSIKTWKTRPGDINLKYKYGLYEYGEILYRDGQYIDGPMPVVYLPNH